MDVNTILRFMVLLQDTQTRTKRKWGRIYFYLFIFFFYCLRICVQWHYTIGGLFSKENPPPRSLYNHDLAQHACFMAAFQASDFAWTIILRSFFFFALFPDCLFFVWCRTKMRMLCFLELSSVRIHSLQFHLMQWRMGLHIHFMQGKVTWACFSGLKYIAKKCTLL